MSDPTGQNPAQPRRKRILCMCEGGFTRSVCLAGHLKNDGGNPLHDALAVSWRFNSAETVDLLCGWADLIVVMEPYMVDKVPETWKSKVQVCDVGPDLYGQPLHPGLLKKVIEWTAAQGLK